MSRLKANILLIFVAMIWGATFIVVKNEIAFISPHLFVAFRFAIASAFLLLVFWKRVFSWTPRVIFAGAVTGICLGVGFVCQTIGMETTTAGKAGFLTGTGVVMVPFMAYFALKRKPSFFQFLGIFFATLGLAFLSLRVDVTNVTIEFGDVLIVLCAFLFSIQIVGNQYFVEYKHRETPLDIGIIQVFFATIAAVVSVFIFDDWTFDYQPKTWGVLAFMGVIVTGVIFIVQPWAQKYTSVFHVVIIFTLEPVFAALFGWLVGGEVLTEKELLGGALIVASMLVAELDFERLRERNWKLRRLKGSL